MSDHAERVAAAERFSVPDAHRLVRDLMVPRMRRYWTDLVLTAGAGWAAAAVLVVLLTGGLTTDRALLALAALGVAVLAFYRAAVFLHEIVHFRARGAFAQFRHGWNLLVGFPLLIPAFMYETHAEHHSRRLYGTSGDAEYVPFARLSPWEIIRVLAATPLLPLFGPFRFGVLAPVSWVVPAARPYVYSRASTLKLDLEYRGRPPRPGTQRRSWLAQEAACAVLVWSVAAGTMLGLVPVTLVVSWALVMTGVVGLNNVRLLGAHRYFGPEDESSVVAQMIDTINYPARPLVGELWGPVGLRLHALHHLLPGLPYHSFREAHARLVAGLPADSAYRLTESPGLWCSIVELWRAARRRDADHRTPQLPLPVEAS